MHPQDLAGVANTPGLPYGTLESAPTTPQHGWASLGATLHLPTQPHVPRTKRKSTLNKDIKPYKQKDPDYVPRPPNSFILFRIDFVSHRPTSGPQVSKSLSKQVSDAWHLLPSYERARWEKAAHEAAIEHAIKNPKWKFRPRKTTKSKERGKSKQPPPQLPQQSTRVSYEDSTPSLDLRLRRESLRLSYWDDSVISPNPRIAAYPNERLDQLPESLRRRSSSVPPLQTSYPDPGAPLAFGNQEDALPDRTSAFPNIPHRLSYSGIRSGFTPMDIFDKLPERSQRKYADDIEPISSLATGPPPSFENYTLRVCSSSSSDPYHQQLPVNYMSPFSQASQYQGMSPAPDLGQWVNNAGFCEPVLPSDIPTNTFPHGGDATLPIMDSLQAPTHSLNSNHGQYPAAGTYDMEEDIITERMRSIDLGDSQSRNIALAPNGDKVEHNISTETKDFSPDIFSELFSQYMIGQDAYQSSGLHDFSEKDVIVGATNKDTEHQLYSLGLDIGYNPLGDELFDEFLTMPPSSGESSVSGSGAGSSPSQRQLDFESAFVQ